MRVLVVEDNPDMASAIRQGLKENGYSVDVAHKGMEGEELAASEPYDLILLDVMLPDRDGVEVCRNLRRRGVTSYILMLTALSSTDQKISGLDAGADDYLAKPFHWEELLARLHALIRRSEGRTSSTIEVGRYRLDEERQRVCTPNGEWHGLTGTEFRLLRCFMTRPNRLFSKEELLEQLYNLEAEPSLNTIEAYIRRLRLLIGRNAIQTQRGQGYVFTAQE